MLWCCLHFPLLPLSALGAEHDGAVVVDQHGSQRWLITGSPECEAGMPLSQAMALCPELPVRVRKPEAEQRALHGLAYWAYRFGQPIAADIEELREPGRIPRALLWIEIGRSLTLFGGLAALRQQIQNELIELGHPAQMAIAPTRSAAALLACNGCSDPVMDKAALGDVLNRIPIHALHWPQSMLKSLTGVGFRCLEDLFRVPRDAFSKRFGVAYRTRLDQLLGEAAEPFEAITPPETFHRRLELPAEVEDTERLRFPLKRLCNELQGYLRSRDCGVNSVTLRVGHASARASRIHARFVDPHRDGERLFNSLHERLSRDGLPMAAREITLLAEDFHAPSVPQHDLFDDRATQQQAWQSAVERIRARLGDDKVWTPHLWPDHRPEHATSRLPPAWPSPDHPAGDLRPTLLLRSPWPMPEPSLPQGTRVERIESGWWDGQDVRRDYVTLSLNGSRAWAYRDRDSGRWFLQGWWA